MSKAGWVFLPSVLALALLFAGARTVLAQDDLLPPTALIPSRPVGEQVFQEHCAACHTTTDFDSRTWRFDTAPVEVASTALGRQDDHPDAVEHLADAWHATAYVWTIPLAPEDVARGVELVQYAQELAQKQGLLTLLIHSGTIGELQDRPWVLSHTPRDVQERLQAVAGDDLGTLTQEELQILVDHIFVTHFELPEGWR